MRILVVGAGGVGGYFGGRLAQAGVDVTFLVRPKRAQRLRETGLSIRSPLGDAEIATPQLVTADRLGPGFDLVLLSCKAYDLADAIASFAPAVGTNTRILPLLNGLGHLDALDSAFGAAQVLGGQCVISATLDAEGRIVHLNQAHTLTFGPRTPGQAAAAEAIAAVFAQAAFETQLSPDILQEMWEKWVFIATLAGITCLMRGKIGDIVAAGGTELILQLLGECAAIAAAHGHAVRESTAVRVRGAFSAAGSPLTASMLRDIQASARIEAQHVIGDLLQRCPPAQPAPLLRVCDVHLRTYELAQAAAARG